MASRPPIPYFAPANQLPAPLPSVDEILASPKPPHGSLVVRVGDHFVVKYGEPDKVRLQEGENMLFVKESSEVPVPTVYALFHDEKTNYNFIVQEFIPGKTVQAIWGGLSTDEKWILVSQLRAFMDKLRSIPPPDYYGGIWKQANLDFYFRDSERGGFPHRDGFISGPKKSEEDWVDAMLRCVALRYKGRYRYLVPLLARPYHAVFKGHKPVFTHADFIPANIILRDDGDVKSPVIINWEFSGWYPSFWEYGICMARMAHGNDWGLWLRHILDEYPAEAGWVVHHRELIPY